VTAVGRVFALTVLAGLTIVGAPAVAHETRPAYLELTETAPGEVTVFWKMPERGALTRGVEPVLPETCRATTPPVQVSAAAARAVRWGVHCPDGLAGGRIAIAGIERTQMDALVRIDGADGRSRTLRLSATDPAATIPEAPTLLGIAKTYLVLGVEHILFGIDHLLFVLTLLLLADGGRRLVGLITAFTVAHSLTLAAATLWGAALAPGPVEALIALSIVLAAAEGVRPEDQRSSLIDRAPWIVAFGFGLLHGFGFAGALSELGLPDGAIPLALLFFNLGVEAGQLIFVAAVLALLAVVGHILSRAHDRGLRHGLGYVAGGMAMVWFLERAGGLLL